MTTRIRLSYRSLFSISIMRCYWWNTKFVHMSLIQTTNEILFWGILLAQFLHLKLVISCIKCQWKLTPSFHINYIWSILSYKNTFFIITTTTFFNLYKKPRTGLTKHIVWQEDSINHFHYKTSNLVKVLYLHVADESKSIHWVDKWMNDTLPCTEK